MTVKLYRQNLLLGWREWASLPDLNVDRIKVKVDTGARTSSLHAFDINVFEHNNKPWVRFSIHPIQRNSKKCIDAKAPLLEKRWIKSSSGHTTLRPVIQTKICIGNEIWPIEMTLVKRDLMGFRMLLGRQAVRNKFSVDPGKSYLLGK